MYPTIGVISTDDKRSWSAGSPRVDSTAFATASCFGFLALEVLSSFFLFNGIDGVSLPSSQPGNGLQDCSQDGDQLDDYNEEDNTSVDDQGNDKNSEPFIQ